ncbi:hypothetical protein ASPSYDRAFT_50254 [Aspergillus sydowii CBS 593.65]|uniref:Trichodiene synthase n=1 Tax=Aspergillus sydowii CBS 593.65 TaxID=1036612 RepID=A0A1L9T460_9EURO|nr:uncharacterized protein ASPSYDRAFT_50254 [Aspergillus sydowii CBS 593.65]OJJ54222.1 hypothetical protein ASPSYDRAFT_50254 [Aspergillus sydowii CBS 593.65]
MEQVSAKDLSEVLVRFLHRFQYDDNDRLPQAELEAIYNFVLPYIPDNKKIVREMADYVHCTFSFLPLEIRQAVALYDAFQMSMDDTPVEQHDSLQGLCAQLSTGDKVQHPVWSEFFKAIPLLLKHYGPYVQTTVFRGALEFIQATCLERTLFRGHADSSYPSYIRRMSAQGPVQTSICFPEAEFPQEKYLSLIASLEAESEDFVALVNDLFSFYKESETPFERINFPLNVAACSGRPVLEVLNEMVEKAAAPWERVQKILGSVDCDQHLYGRVHAFFKGYVRYHLSCARYKIAGLCAEAGNEELHRFYQMSVVARNGQSN